jgi:uncharacterized membrane protein/mono/diheme cytochrome c family protein
MSISITEFIGHLHPVLVHLPIGILLLASLFLWQSRKDKSEHLQPVINVILLLGMISAILTCITGYVLSTTGEYDEDMVNFHQWMGISVAVVSILTYYFFKKNILYRWQGLVAAILLLLLIITGHLGGSLTHGADYLTQPLQNLSGDSAVITKRKPIPNVQEAIAYTDIIQPVFKEKCYGCHGPSKQKGKLRLDQPDLIMKGGKDGVVIVAGKSKESELVKRILLPREEEHHMSPKEKPQLSAMEIALLQWWVDNGADFTKKVKDLPQPEKIKPHLAALQKEGDEQKELTGIPAAPVEKADEKAIDALRKSGVVILPVSQNSNYLKANFSIGAKTNDSAIALLLPIKKQLVSLKLSDVPVTDSSLTVIAQCSLLSRLELDHTQVTDNGMGKLQPLDQLLSLNLVGTKVSAEGILKLKGMKKLHNIYLYQSAVAKKDWPLLTKNLPKAILDSGGYTVPLFNTDTMTVKPPKTQ